MTRSLAVAAIQASFGQDMAANIARVSELVREAAGRGAQVDLDQKYTLNQPGLGRCLEGLPRQRTSGTSALGRISPLGSGQQADVRSTATPTDHWDSSVRF